MDDGLYIVTSPEFIEAILHDRNDLFLKSGSPENRDMVSFPSSVMNSSGDDWAFKRKAMQPDFSLRQVSSALQSTFALTESHLAQWQTGPTSRDIRPLLQQLCFDVGCQFLLNMALDREDRAAFIALSEAIILKTRDPVRLPFNLFDRTASRLKTARESAKTVAQAALARAGQQQARGRAAELGVSFVNRASLEDAEWLCDEFCAMVLSGLEPMSAALAWALHLLTSHPEVLKRVTAEADLLSGVEWATGGGSVNLDAFPQARAALMEALRLFPPAWLTGRNVARDTTLGNFDLAAGSAVMISPWINHRNARFFEEPDRFRPERWLDGTLQQHLPRYAFFPFGGGIRRCIGEHFSLLHMTLILVCILRRFILEPPSKTRAKAYPALVLRPLNVKLALMPRVFAGETMGGTDECSFSRQSRTMVETI